MSSVPSSRQSLRGSEPAWFVVDATGKSLAPREPNRDGFRGKHKPSYTTHEDTGDFVIVVNCDKVADGQQARQKMLYTHSGIRAVSRRELPATCSSESPSFDRKASKDAPKNVSA